MQIPFDKEILLPENYPTDKLGRLYVTVLFVVVKRLETIHMAIKWGLLNTMDYHPELGRNEEALSIPTWADLQTILFIEKHMMQNDVHKMFPSVYKWAGWKQSLITCTENPGECVRK